jgi:hypothetical protein
VKVLAWTIGTCERNAEKKRYTAWSNSNEYYVSEKMRVAYSNVVAQGQPDPGLTRCLQREGVECRLLQSVA